MPLCVIVDNGWYGFYNVGTELEQMLYEEEQMIDLDNETEVVSQGNAQVRPFNPSEHLMQIKSEQGTRDYLPVQWRLVWFRSAFPYGSIETEMLHLDLDRETEEEVYVWNAERRRSEKIIRHAKGFVIFRAVVKDGQGGVGTGTKSEKAASFPDFIEKAETGAIGRALAAWGDGTPVTGDEWDEAHRIVDSPVDRHPVLAAKSGGDGNRGDSYGRRSEQEAELAISEQQLSSIL